MLKYIYKPLGFIIANFFTILFIVGLTFSLSTPTGRKVGSVVVKEAAAAASELPELINRSKPSRINQAFSYVGSGIMTAGKSVVTGAAHTAFYYVGSVGIIALMLYVIYGKFNTQFN